MPRIMARRHGELSYCSSSDNQSRPDRRLLLGSGYSICRIQSRLRERSSTHHRSSTLSGSWLGPDYNWELNDQWVPSGMTEFGRGASQPTPDTRSRTLAFARVLCCGSTLIAETVTPRGAHSGHITPTSRVVLISRRRRSHHLDLKIW